MHKLANISSFESIMNRSEQPVRNGLWDKTKKAGMTAAMMAALSGLPGTGYAVEPEVGANPIQKVESAVDQGKGFVNKLAKTLRRAGKAINQNTVTFRYERVDGPFGAVVRAPGRKPIYINADTSQQFCEKAARALRDVAGNGQYAKIQIDGKYPGSSQTSWLQETIRQQFPNMKVSSTLR